jgi:glycosyltransferase involved in cell wall biosynthesis
MNKITLIYAYYNCPTVIPLLVENWNRLPDNVKVIVVDDCSTPSFDSIISDYILNKYISVYRIHDDIKWNQPGAWNLGITKCDTEWFINMPVDRTIPDSTIDIMSSCNLDPNYYYTFRDALNGVVDGNFPPGIMMLNTRIVNALGLFDEDFCGNYGYDDIIFREKINKHLTPICLENWIMDVIFAASDEHGLSRDSSVNQQLMIGKQNGSIPSSKNYLRFKWERVR